MHLVSNHYNCDCTNQEIVAGLLGNPSVPINLRERLWERYKTTPNDESEYLEDWDMRLAVAFNPQTSEEQRIEYLQQLLSNQVSHIGWKAGGYVYQNIAKNPLTPISILEFIVENIRGGIRDVLENPNVPVSVLRQAAQNNNSTIQELIIKNPNTPEDLLEELTSGQMSLQNPNLTPLDIYKNHLEKQSEQETEKAQRLISKRNSNQRIFQKSSNKQTPTLQSLPRIYNPDTDDLPNLLQEYINSNNSFVRFITLLHPLTPEETLTQVANSASWLERYAVAENESTPLEIRSILSNDSNRIVKTVANNNS